MAPTTRAARNTTSFKTAPNGGGVFRKPIRKQHSNGKGAWKFNDTDDHHNHEDQDQDVRESVEVHHDEPLQQLDGAGDMDEMDGVEEALRPLRETADRVGREVEAFAVSFDEFLIELRTRGDSYSAARDLAQTYKAFADNEVADLQKTHQKERMLQLRKEWRQRVQLSANNAQSGAKASRGGVVSEMKAEKVQELREWQQESDTWDLFSIVLDFWYDRDARRRERDGKLANLAPPHRYTPEKEIWERFLLENEIALEHHLYKEWLERTADHQESDIDGIMEELEALSGSGKGLWNRGWLNSRERIKGEKRVRSWPSPSDSVQPQLRTSAGNDMLVTNLDPDAPTRQDRALEQSDKYFERAMWIACWEMLRRGKPWAEIAAWCEDHNEGFRAAMLSPALDSSDASSNAAWRKMCYLASESGCSNDHEAAVYGLLGGNIKAVQKVCRTVDDHLFAHYSCMLVRQFDQYLQTRYPGRVASFAVQRSEGDDIPDTEEKAQQAISQVIKRLRTDPATHGEAISPLKIIECYLLANDAESLAANVGTGISDLDSLRGGKEEAVIRMREAPSELPAEAAIAADSHALRIVTHIYCILTAIDPSEQPDNISLTAEENVLAAYIQTIRTVAKRDHIPVYATRLRHLRSILVMSRALQDIHDSRDQQEMLRLMARYGLPIEYILKEQLRYTLASKADMSNLVVRPAQIVEACEISQLSPGQRIIEDFSRGDLTDDDMMIVRSLKWLQLLRGHWELTFRSLAHALRTCLLTGRLACAGAIVHDFPSETIAEQKSFSTLGKNVNVLDKSIAPEDENSDEALEWNMMRQQARAYYELEQLVHAISALALWVEQERVFTSDPRNGDLSAPSMLRNAKEELDETMAPLLTGVLLQADDEEDQHYLDKLRNAYLPEVLIAYSIALYTAGITISRECYIESMDLSIAIASEGNGVADAFVAAGRMRELVKIFAQTSKMMLIMNNRPLKKGLRTGKSLGIWEIAPQGSDAGVVATPDDS
ncbi:Nucleoporin nup84 [Elasticomyces elasticus]|nr:Nucleoporin nup84 [Elasticomyces elasticus]